MPIPIPRPTTGPVPPYGGGSALMQYLMQRQGMPSRMGMSAAQTTPTETPLGEGQTPYNQGNFTPPATIGTGYVPQGAIVHGTGPHGEALWSFPHPGAIIHLAHPDAYHGQGPMTPAQSSRISAALNYRQGGPAPPSAPQPVPPPYSVLGQPAGPETPPQVPTQTPSPSGFGGLSQGQLAMAQRLGIRGVPRP